MCVGVCGCVCVCVGGGGVTLREKELALRVYPFFLRVFCSGSQC